MQAIQAWQLLLVALAGWINRHQQDVIAYIQEENRILKGKLKGSLRLSGFHEYPLSASSSQ